MDELRYRRLSTANARGGWLQRALFALAGAVFLVFAFFFITVALVAAAFVALAIGVRFWWTLRRLRKEAERSAALEGEFTVIEHGERIEHDRRG